MLQDGRIIDNYALVVLPPQNATVRTVTVPANRRWRVAQLLISNLDNGNRVTYIAIAEGGVTILVPWNYATLTSGQYSAVPSNYKAGAWVRPLLVPFDSIYLEAGSVITFSWGSSAGSAGASTPTAAIVQEMLA